MEVQMFNENISNEFKDLESARHKNAKPPLEAYLFFPKAIDIFYCQEPNDMKNFTRRIFESPTEYLDIEKMHINNFKNELRRISPNMENFLEDSIILRFCQATKNDYRKAIDFILDHLKWKEVTFPISINDNIRKILNSGFIYVHGRDNRFRPIVILNPDIYLKNLNLYSYDDWMQSIVYLFDYIMKNCLIPGQVENWSIICNVFGTNVLFLPRDLKRMIDILTRNFSGRLYAMYIINVSVFLQVVWNTVKILLDSITQNKIKLFSEKETSFMLFNYVNKKQVEKKFGGVAQNVENHYFPPIFPSNDYFLPNEKKEEILITEKRYIEIVRKNKNITVSPYINEMIERNGKNISEEASIYEDAYSKFSKEESSKYEECVGEQDAKPSIPNNEYITPDFMEKKIDDKVTIIKNTSKEEIILVETDDNIKPNLLNKILINNGDRLDKTAEKSYDSKLMKETKHGNKLTKGRKEINGKELDVSIESLKSFKSNIVKGTSEEYFDAYFKAIETIRLEEDESKKNVCCGYLNCILI